MVAAAVVVVAVAVVAVLLVVVAAAGAAVVVMLAMTVQSPCEENISVCAVNITSETLCVLTLTLAI